MIPSKQMYILSSFYGGWHVRVKQCCLTRLWGRLCVFTKLFKLSQIIEQNPSTPVAQASLHRPPPLKVPYKEKSTKDDSNPSQLAPSPVV